MKLLRFKHTAQSVFLCICLLAVFLLGISIGRSLANNQKTTEDAPVALCQGNKLCNAAPLSIFSKEKLTEAGATGNAGGKGFCLPVSVLMYHHVQPQEIAQQRGQTSLNVDNGIFDTQMAYLASHGYTTISATQLVQALLTHTQLPGKDVVVTFDDGYLDNYTYAFPVLQKYHLTGNLMAATGLLGTTAATNEYYSWDQLRQMVGSGVMYAYNHTWSHYPLAQGPADKDRFEVKTGQQQLQDHLGKVDPIFVYPYGSGQTVGWVKKLLREDGYVAAFSTLYGRVSCDGDIMALPRIHVGNASLASYGL